jgi:hypothetical protein
MVTMEMVEVLDRVEVEMVDMAEMVPMAVGQ